MTGALERLNALPPEEAVATLVSCCGSSEWARRVAAARPFGSEADLGEASDRIWRGLSRADWLEAFAAHPKIGSSVAAGPAQSRAWSLEEQRGASGASSETLADLAAANRAYEGRFGHIFIVCASGRTADEMLELARQRLGNDAESELALAAEEQRKITRLRLEKLIAPGEK
ncbi:MAG: 2-oxo-4-hydroxy-4-carboxy-5-ureidoimidazoline decarboxylase [Acidobacteriota bacterium]|nr:2-oxo-4-hydroxy-4-carboxy-5-ureidoimidazoline decarboxylase [Acidobacteriota bacterium]